MILSNSPPLIPDYSSVLKKHLFEDCGICGPLIYSEKYSDGTLTTLSPQPDAKNCAFVNGYPHVTPCRDVCMQQIMDFINGVPVYSDRFCIRYGDTHPHRPLPALAQYRNLILGETLYSFIQTGAGKTLLYPIGDISLKSIGALCGDDAVCTAFLKDILHGTPETHRLFDKWEENASQAVETVRDFLLRNWFATPQLLRESALYRRTDLYDFVSGIPCTDGLSKEGNLRYTLQELMFILTYKDSILLNVIGSNQSDHIHQVLALLRDTDISTRVGFVPYGICKNAKIYDPSALSDLGGEFSKLRTRCLLKSPCTGINLVRLICLGTSINRIIDYSHLDNIELITDTFEEIFLAMCNSSPDCHAARKQAQLPDAMLFQMSLVYENLHQSIRAGDPSIFVRYVSRLARQYNLKWRTQVGSAGLFRDFLSRCLVLLRLSEFC